MRQTDWKWHSGTLSASHNIMSHISSQQSLSVHSLKCSTYTGKSLMKQRRRLTSFTFSRPVTKEQVFLKSEKLHFVFSSFKSFKQLWTLQGKRLTHICLHLFLIAYFTQQISPDKKYVWADFNPYDSIGFCRVTKRNILTLPQFPWCSTQVGFRISGIFSHLPFDLLRQSCNVETASGGSYLPWPDQSQAVGLINEDKHLNVADCVIYAAQSVRFAIGDPIIFLQCYRIARMVQCGRQ